MHLNVILSFRPALPQTTILQVPPRREIKLHRCSEISEFELVAGISFDFQNSDESADREEYRLVLSWLENTKRIIYLFNRFRSLAVFVIVIMWQSLKYTTAMVSNTTYLQPSRPSQI